MTDYPTVPYRHHTPDEAPEALSAAFYERMNRRRSVRGFSDRPVAKEVIENLVRAAGTAPSGANKQPWRFVCVSDPGVKRAIREAAENEERLFYETRASERWLEDLAPLGTDPEKPFLEIAPWLVVLFKLRKTDEGGQVYYLNESVGIAAGLFITAVHEAGLVTLTHTPSPMGFLSKVLERPAHEVPFLLMPVGYPAPDCRVPDIHRKPFESICAFVE